MLNAEIINTVGTCLGAS